MTRVVPRYTAKSPLGCMLGGFVMVRFDQRVGHCGNRRTGGMLTLLKLRGMRRNAYACCSMDDPGVPDR